MKTRQTKKLPAISVIMSVYNQRDKEKLDAAIMSILRQSFQDFEFIIYDDGSDIDMISHLEYYARLDERIVLITNPVNHGLAYSLNSCIDVARGKYLARMDDDDVSLPHRLEVQYDFMERHPEIAFAGCNARLLDENGVWGERQMPEKPEKKDFLRFSPYIHPTVIIRRSIFEEGNLYNAEKQHWRCEDYELFMRLFKAGYRGCNIQQTLFLYREERCSYEKRRFCYRINEFHLRYRNFKELSILFPFGWLYVLRPLAAAFVPDGLTWRIKKLYHRQDLSYERYQPAPKEAVSENFANGSSAMRAFR